MLAPVLTALTANLILLAKQNGSLTIAQAEQQLSIKRATIKLHLANLVKCGQLIKHGTVRST